MMSCCSAKKLKSAGAYLIQAQRLRGRQLLPKLQMELPAPAATERPRRARPRTRGACRTPAWQCAAAWRGGVPPSALELYEELLAMVSLCPTDVPPAAAKAAASGRP